MTLDQLKPGQSAVIVHTGGEGALRQHLLNMGVVPGAAITRAKSAPMGDPMAFRLQGYTLALRAHDAKAIAIAPSGSSERSVRFANTCRNTAGPGPGGGGSDRARAAGTPLPAGVTLTFALAGNPNCGKTTLFNQLTGMNQHVGNFPGVTVDRRDGAIRGHANAQVTDLPGIYALSPYSSEEQITRAFILGEKPRGIINIVDATNLPRSLCLTMQLMELGMPMVLALNMMDELTSGGGSVRVREMEAMLGIPVVPISAAKNEGVDELVSRAIHAAQYQQRPSGTEDCVGPVRRCLDAIMQLVADRASAANLPVRFAAVKLAEGDMLMARQLRLSQTEAQAVEHSIAQMEKALGLDRAAAIAAMRFSHIRRICDETWLRPREHTHSKRLDRLLAGRYTAIPAFIAIMALVFCLTFNVVGAALSKWLEGAIGLITARVDALMQAAAVSSALRSLVIDGIFTGVGSVLSFLPFILVLFFCLCMLEDSGYMARVAFVMDKPLRRIGLSGRSIVPMLMGFGCTVPGVMATRTLPSARDRRLTILLTPFMSCSAKLPIYAFFAAVFFPEHAGLVMAALYALGIAAGVAAALLLKRAAFAGELAPFVMELPNYRLPGAKNVARLLWDKARDFLERAFTVILLATIAIWFLQTFDMHLRVVSHPENSLLALLAGVLAPILAPLGFGDWRFATALIAGFLAKESVVSTLTVLFASPSALLAALSPLSAAALLLFCLLYTPCVAAVSAVKRELGGRWALAMVLGQCAIAYIAALALRLTGLSLGFR